VHCATVMWDVDFCAPLILRWVNECAAKAANNPQVKEIVDRVSDRFASTSEHQVLGVQDLYCAILLVYK
jgi:hypothetical protein